MVTIIDYGLSNLLSIKRAIERCGDKAQMTNDYHEVLNATRVILPGVGAFRDGMKGLKKYELDKAIRDVAVKDIPILGICLGMQMLMEESEENGINEGLSLIQGRVEKIKPIDEEGKLLRIPHVGWNELNIIDKIRKKNIIDESFEKSEVYFVHSYEVKPKKEENIVATIQYGGRDICAIVGRDNVVGCQFHPEKSGKVGLKIIHNFIQM